MSAIMWCNDSILCYDESSMRNLVKCLWRPDEVSNINKHLTQSARPDSKICWVANFHDLLIGSATKFRSHTDTDTIIIMIIMISRHHKTQRLNSMNHTTVKCLQWKWKTNTNLLQFSKSCLDILWSSWFYPKTKDKVTIRIKFMWDIVCIDVGGIWSTGVHQ